jgi:dihydroflavonol-4-reductase
LVGTILVTGGSGFIAGYLIRQLVADGWRVNTTIRSLARESEVRRLLAVDDAAVRFFAADLSDDPGWTVAASGCSHVAHVASPFPNGAPRHEDDLIIPARDGALRVLRAAREAKVRRFVMTSSSAAIAYGHALGRTNRYTERDWTDATSLDAYPYVRSKTIAERAARDWVAAEGGALEYVSVNPSLVLGPVWSGDYATSVVVIEKLMNGSLPGLPDLGFGVVDVRDIADLHVRALTADGIAGERFIGSGPFMRLRQIAIILKAHLGYQARRVPTRALPDWLVRIGARFDPAVQQVVGELGRVRDMDASHAREVLGWLPRPTTETIVDTACSLIAHGLVKV